MNRIQMSTFLSRRNEILQTLYGSGETAPLNDASLRKMVDEPIADVIRLINEDPHFVTTSCCSGRVSIFLDAGPGGRKNGGRLIFASHDVVTVEESSMLIDRIKEVLGSPGLTAYDTLKNTPGMIQTDIKLGTYDETWECAASNGRVLWLSCEPFIVHLEAVSLIHAQRMMSLLSQEARVKDVGLISVGERFIVKFKGTQQLSMPIAKEDGVGVLRLMITDITLKNMVRICNQKLKTNLEQIGKLKKCLEMLSTVSSSGVGDTLSKWILVRNPNEISTVKKQLEELMIFDRSRKPVAFGGGKLLPIKKCLADGESFLGMSVVTYYPENDDDDDGKQVS